MVNWKEKLALKKAKETPVENLPADLIDRVKSIISDQKIIVPEKKIEIPVKKQEQKIGIDYAVQPAGSLTLASGVSQIVMERNPHRKIGIIVNDGAVPIYLALGTKAILNAGIRLNANGGAFWFGIYTDCFWTGYVAAIAASDTQLTYVEA
jgi:hypothetical protein